MDGNYELVMVLNDGETYTDLPGCAIVAVPDDVADEDTEHFVKSAMKPGNREYNNIVTRFS